MNRNYSGPGSNGKIDRNEGTVAIMRLLSAKKMGGLENSFDRGRRYDDRAGNRWKIEDTF